MSIDFITGMVFGVIICIIIGHVLLHIAQRRIDRLMKQLFVNVKETVDKLTVPVRVELQNGIFYIYRVKDNSFLVQGATMAEIREKVQVIAKDMHVYIAEGDDDVIRALKNTDTNAGLEADRV